MTSRRHLRTLIEVHHDAQHLADQAANILDGAAVLSAMSRSPHMHDTVRLVEHATTLHTDIGRVIARLEEVTPDD